VVAVVVAHIEAAGAAAVQSSQAVGQVDHLGKLVP
jgi:hypothetical protein